jgi:hypothetical protein
VVTQTILNNGVNNFLEIRLDNKDLEVALEALISKALARVLEVE